MMIRQSEAAECELASLAMVAQAHGAKVDLNGLRARFGLSLKGAGLRDLMRMADELGFGTRALRLDLDHLKELKLPAILHWDLNHFVVLAKVGRDKVTVLDPAFGERRMGESYFRMGLSGPRPEKVACRRETRAGSTCEQAFDSRPLRPRKCLSSPFGDVLSQAWRWPWRRTSALS